MTNDFSLRPAPEARCPMCRSPLIGMSGTNEFRTFPSEHVRFDLFVDGLDQDVTVFPPAAVQQFTATFAPCGCQWEARDRAGLWPFVLYIIHTDAGPTFEFGHRQHDNKYAMYMITREKDKR
jgi:hypothetical protein